MTGPPIRLGLAIGALDRRPAGELTHLVRVAEDAGFEMVLVAEAWGRDAFVTLGSLASRTERIRLGTGIVNVYSRSPAAIAMAAVTLDDLSGGRAVLGLGVSGKAVIEGWHGTPMDRPLHRLRETTEAVRAVVRRDRAGYAGETIHVGPRFALAFDAPRERIPIYHACLTPAAIRQCGEIADGWLPYLLTTDTLRSDLRSIEAGLRAAGRDRAHFTVATFVPALVADDAAAARSRLRQHIAFYVGAMGRFYHEVVSRQGHAEAADRVRAEWQAGRRDAAVDAVPDELVDALAVCGPPERCRAKLEELAGAGADIAVVYLPESAERDEAERTLRALGALVSAEP